MSVVDIIRHSDVATEPGGHCCQDRAI